MATQGNTILVINEEEELAGHLQRWGFRVEEARTGKEGLAKAQLLKPATAVVDVVLPDMNGLDVLKTLHAGASTMPVIMLSPLGHPRLVAEVMRLGAWGFLTKPVNLDQMREALRGAVACRRKEQPGGGQPGYPVEAERWEEGLWISEKMRRISRLVDQLANNDATVLLRGETGVGKELVARALHWRSERSGRPWARVNCAALPAELIELELFGYEKGAFTGAQGREPGRFEQADGGTIFLDEIGQMPLSTQGKLLHVLQDREFTPLGGGRSVRTNARVVASTNQDLERALETGTFRKDLYYRLNVINLWIPPLRERREEIPIFVKHFLRKFSRQDNLRDVEEISPALLRHFMAYDWPGNVRELENAIKQVVVLGEETGVLEDLTRHACPKAKVGTRELKPKPISLKDLSRRAARDAERSLIHSVLIEMRWDRLEAARRLGISYKSLLWKMRACGLSPKP